MVRAWYLDSSDADKSLPHMTDPPQMVSMDELKAKTRIEYFKVDPDNYVNDAAINKLKKDRKFSYEDELDHAANMADYAEKSKIYYDEHIHSDDEIRLVFEGSGYFDARDKADKWIRVEVVRGDMIILPKGIYHRFTLDSNKHIKAKRYFVGEPVWTAINRHEACNHPARKGYETKMGH